MKARELSMPPKVELEKGLKTYAKKKDDDRALSS